MERNTIFVGGKQYSKSEGTYTVARVTLDNGMDAYVAGVKLYVIVALHEHRKPGKCIPTYVSVVLDCKHSWNQLTDDEVLAINPALIKDFYDVLNVLEHGEDTSKYTTVAGDKEEFIDKCDFLTEDQRSEIMLFLEDIDGV